MLKKTLKLNKIIVFVLFTIQNEYVEGEIDIRNIFGALTLHMYAKKKKQWKIQNIAFIEI